MSEIKIKNNAGQSPDKVAIDLIWDLLGLESVLLELVTQWTDVNAIAVREKPIPPQDSTAGPMPIGLAYFICKELRGMKPESRVDRAARNMSETVLNDMH